jgi:hypothetical protein
MIIFDIARDSCQWKVNDRAGHRQLVLGQSSVRVSEGPRHGAPCRCMVTPLLIGSRAEEMDEDLTSRDRCGILEPRH